MAEEQTTTPTGLCQCGCGKATKLAAVTRADRKQIRGQPLLYRQGHGRRRLERNQAIAKGLDWCRECRQEKSLDSFFGRNSNKQRVCRDCARQVQAKWRERNPERSRFLTKSNQLKRAYGITVEQLEELNVKQNGLCAICQKPETKKRKDGTLWSLHVDHSHSTGKVRGLLCSGCNTAIGLLCENLDTINAAYEYIKLHQD